MSARTEFIVNFKFIIMKNPHCQKAFFVLLVLFSSTISSFAQFGGGTGTETDPYQIWNKSHWDELADSYNVWLDDSIINTCSDTTGYLGVHFRLMSDIDEVIEKCIPVAYTYDTTTWEFNEIYFNGFFHGGGHCMNVKINDVFDSTGRFLFHYLSETAYIDSLEVRGSPINFLGIVDRNYGTIKALISNLTEITGLDSNPWLAGICKANMPGGLIINCCNYSNISLTTGGGIAGICLSNQGIVSYCKNIGNIYLKHGTIGGVVRSNHAIVDHCINYGNISSGEADTPNLVGFGGICQSAGQISNCINIGSVNSSIKRTGGISGYGGNIQNCANYGIITCTYPDNGGISGTVSLNGIIIRHSLNIAKTSNSAITPSIDNSTISNNYYDKQMCLSKGINGEDVPGSAEGKLTTQLTGTSPELQAMLGDGWSYAEGRYPIPLGLENDSMALVAATPIYLYTENENSYNHVDSVSKNFTVGLENNVNWNATNERVSFSDENVTLLSLGIENLTVSLGDYSKKVRINILDTEVSTTHQSIENGISVYPNPANENITINLNNSKADKLEISDITGKIVFSSNAIKVNQILNISHLKQGIYILKLIENENIIFTEKFIKQE